MKRAICEGDLGHLVVGVIFGSLLVGLVGVPAAGIPWSVGVAFPREYLSWGLVALMAIIVTGLGRHHPEDIPLEVGMVIGAAAPFIPWHVGVVPMYLAVHFIIAIIGIQNWFMEMKLHSQY